MHLSCIWNTSVLSHLKTLKGQQTGCITHLQCQCLKCMFAIILNSITTRLVQKNKKTKQNWALSPSLTASVARWLGLKVWKLSLHLQEHNALNNIISLHLPLDCFTGVEQTRVHPIRSIPILRDQTVIRPSQNRRCSYSSSIQR